MKKLMGDQDHIRQKLFAYLGFSPAVRDIFESFDLQTQIERLAKSGPPILGRRKGLPSGNEGFLRAREFTWERTARAYRAPIDRSVVVP